MKSELISKIKKLAEISRKLQNDLENFGLSPTDGNVGTAFNQFFYSNVKDIVSSSQSLARGDHGEGASLRLKKTLPSARKNIEKLSQTPQGTRLIEQINEIKTILDFIERIYQDL